MGRNIAILVIVEANEMVHVHKYCGYGSVFGDGSSRSKSLDEVILAYLHDDMADDE